MVPVSMTSRHPTRISRQCIFHNQIYQKWCTIEWLDYCNSVLAMLPVNLIWRLQSVQNAAARLTFGIRRSEHIKYALASLHWLHVPDRILYKVACWPTEQWTAVHLSTCHLTLSRSPTCHLDCGFDHLIPTNLWCHPTISLPSAGGPSRSSPPTFGIVFLWTLPQHCHSQFSGSISRLTSFVVLTLT